MTCKDHFTNTHKLNIYLPLFLIFTLQKWNKTNPKTLKKKGNKHYKISYASKMSEKIKEYKKLTLT